MVGTGLCTSRSVAGRLLCQPGAGQREQKETLARASLGGFSSVPWQEDAARRAWVAPEHQGVCRARAGPAHQPRGLTRGFAPISSPAPALLPRYPEFFLGALGFTSVLPGISRDSVTGYSFGLAGRAPQFSVKDTIQRLLRRVSCVCLLVKPLVITVTESIAFLKLSLDSDQLDFREHLIKSCLWKKKKKKGRGKYKF